MRSQHFKYTIIEALNRGRTSSVGRALECRARGRRFDLQDRTGLTRGLKITELCRPCPEKGKTFAWK